MRKAVKIVAGVVLVLGVGVVTSLHFAGKALKTQIEAALGAESEVGSISLGLMSVSIEQLRIKAPAGWPAAETLRAERIRVVPDWSALLSKRIGLRSIEVEGAYLSLLRTPEGKLRLLPSLLEKPKSADSGPPPEVRIGEVRLSNAAVDFFDASVKKPAHKIVIEDVQARLSALHLPALDADSDLEIKGTLKGVQHDGEFGLDGHMVLANLDSKIVTRLRGVDLVAMQPYLVKAAEAGVKRGTLDMDITSAIKQRKLHAQGSVTLHKLELESNGGFLGLPRQAAVGALKDGKDDIRVSFVLEGNLDDPRFSLNESIAMRFGAGLAETLGVSIGGLGQAVGQAASSVGSTIKGLFK